MAFQWGKYLLMKSKTVYNTIQSKIVFLFDVHNTLLDRDCFVSEFRLYLEKEIGLAGSLKVIGTSWTNDGVNSVMPIILAALQRYRIKKRHDLRFLAVSTFLINYPFINRLYPNSLKVIEHVKQFGRTAICPDGDAVFQPHKIDRSRCFCTGR